MSWPNWRDHFPPTTWRSPDQVSSFPAAPYPGIRPEGSFMVMNGNVHGLDLCGDGWISRTTGEPVPLDGLSFVLAYGSNGNPQKLAKKLGTAIAIRCAVRDHAAVWCDARRLEGSVVATLAPDPKRIEVHHVLAVTDYELDLIDRWEGHPTTYERRVMPAGSVLLESGEVPQEVLVYIGTRLRRPPLYIDGALWRTADHTYDEVDTKVS